MAVDGAWNLTMQTPMGARTTTLALTSNGGVLSGTQSAEGQSAEIFDGKVSGDDVSWKVKITSPMPLTLEFRGKVSGDSMEGKVSAGFVGSWGFSGSRA
ncbi:hypothetical protein ACFFJB_07270 [Camelimonas abortus]|uniref:Uncharacterized protein n=1 Tax=Camelimonas abortus TaxID=1017184 RepID=A0ABV7LGC1_9HYPH